MEQRKLSPIFLQRIVVILSFFLLNLPKEPLFASSKDLLLQAIPVSPMTPVGKTWTYEVNTLAKAGLSNSAWSVTFDERAVFLARLKHNQLDNQANSWNLRLGKGGQIYSLTNTTRGVTKEYIPPQYQNMTSPYGYTIAPWIDEVFQIVSVNTSLNNPNNPYFIHQAGIYLSDRSFRQTKPFFSPLLAHGKGKQSNAYVTINWGQQAHVPTSHSSALIYYTQVRDVGEGIIEITNIIYNFGEISLDHFNTPWGGTRRSSLNTHIISNPASATLGWKEENGMWRKAISREINKTNGWIAFAEGTNLNNRALGLVFGFDVIPPKEFQESESLWRWGFAGGEKRERETNWRNYLVGTLIRKIRLEPGYILSNRYYLIVSSLKNVDKSIKKYQLAQNAGYKVFTYNSQESPVLSWYLTENGQLTTSIPKDNSSPIVKTYAWPVKDTKPVFVLKNKSTAKTVITTNPYLFCLRLVDKYCRTYDGNTIYHGFLGYSSQLKPRLSDE